MEMETNDTTQPRASEEAGTTEVTQGTDVHRSKIPADDPRLRLNRPTARSLRRGPILIAAGVLATSLAVGLVAAITGSSKNGAAPKGQAEPDVQASTAPPLPDVIKDPPADAEGQKPRLGARRSNVGVADSGQSGAVNGATLREVREEESLKARAAALFAANVQGPLTEQGPPVAQPSPQMPAPGSPAPPARGTPSDRGQAPAPNYQERKNDFLARAGVSDAEYLEKAATAPRSPYEVKAGSVIPTVLITGINSDLPGQVVAQVRENVYDTVTGNYLLIPQGSRLLAAYDSMIAWGQQRVLVCWNRLIRPDGSSLALDCMPGTDLSGYSGFRDEVDNHWWRIIGGAVISSFLAATAQRSQGNVTGYQPSFPQAWATGAAGAINEAGQQLTAKNLQIQPTITVRPGFSVNVLVTRDIVIPPYPLASTAR
jgi:type IV secretory pathway VirB10-like protein